jgi:UDP-N-acetylmuramyl pentapeptide synthase
MRNQLTFRVKRIVNRDIFRYVANLTASWIYRRYLNDVTFIAITGSCGKTTTKDVSAAILSSRYRIIKSLGGTNVPRGITKTILKTRRWHDYCVQEIGTWGPGTIDTGLRLFRPQIGVLLNVRNDHYSHYRGIKNTILEKKKLIASLPDNGIAILNMDDPLVGELKESTRARVLTFGISPDADIRATDVEDAWPSTLSFTVHYEKQSMRVQSQLVGVQFIGTALASLGIAISCAIPLEQAVAELEKAEPTEARMKPILHPDGIIFLGDYEKAPWDSMPEIVEFMKKARARRKIAVIGTISDYPGSASSKYRKVARELADHVDRVIFVDRYAPSYFKKLLKENDKIRVFKTLKEANGFLETDLQKGDLVLIKASSLHHFERIIVSRETSVSCWVNRCLFTDRHCPECHYLHDPAEPHEQRRPKKKWYSLQP